MNDYVSINETAEKIGVKPKAVSDMLYQRPPELDLSRCPRIGARRVIARDYVPEIQRILRAHSRKRQETLAV